MERVWQRDYANHAEATTDITDDTIGFYNSMQLHSKLGNLPLNAFEHHLRASIGNQTTYRRVRNNSPTTNAILPFIIRPHQKLAAPNNSVMTL